MRKYCSQFLVERINQEKPTTWSWLTVSDRDNCEIHIPCSGLLIFLRVELYRTESHSIQRALIGLYMGISVSVHSS